jgi:hypothetical protein
MERKWFTDRGQGGRISIIIRVNGFASIGSMVSRSLGSWFMGLHVCVFAGLLLLFASDTQGNWVFMGY